MRFCLVLLLLVAGAGRVHAEPRSVLVELTAPAVAHMVASRRLAGQPLLPEQLALERQRLRDAQKQLLERLIRRGFTARLRRLSLDHPGQGEVLIPLQLTLVLNAMNLLVPEEELSALRQMPEVKAVHPDRVFSPMLNQSVEYIAATPVYGVDAQADPAGPASGNQGQGVRIAIIDSGVDWLHPMFGGPVVAPPRLGLLPEPPAGSANEKVIYNLPLAEVLVNDGRGHGTHVASIAAGYPALAPGPDGLPMTADDLRVHGVAPQAQVMSYKVCNDINATLGIFGAPSLQCAESIILLALEDAVSPVTLTGFEKPVADVINISLGSAGTPEDATARAADSAALMGAIVVASAGNGGPNAASIQSPALASQVIGVGASNDPGAVRSAIEVLGAGTSRRITAGLAPHSNLTLPPTLPLTGHYVYAGLADTPDQVPLSVRDNICLAIMGDSVQVAVVRTGILANKALQCAAKGAVAMVLYNDEPGSIGATLIPAAIPVFTIAGRDGEWLHTLGYDEAGVSHHALRIGTQDPDNFQPAIADLSARGPVAGGRQVKPDLVAPGVNILAAAPTLSSDGLIAAGTQFIHSTGTSMAAPHIAGAAALLRQAHPSWSPAMVRTALINTATAPRNATGQPQPEAAQTVLDQGGGLVHVAAAAHAQAVLGVAGDGIERPEILGSHSFGLVQLGAAACEISRSVDVLIRDVSGEAARYTLSAALDDAATHTGGNLSFSSEQIALPAGGQVAFTATLELVARDALMSETDLYTMGGLIVAESNGLELRLPWSLTLATSGQGSACVSGEARNTAIPSTGLPTRGGGLGSVLLLMLLMNSLRCRHRRNQA